MNTKIKGDIAESQVIAKFLRLGKSVLIPFGDRNRYDLVIEENGKFERIQVKTAKLFDNYLKFSAKSVTTKNGKTLNINYKGQADKFAVFCPDLDKVYVINVDDCCEDTVILRLTTPKNNQKLKIKYAKDYELASSLTVKTLA